jgi:hypothetical protein
MEIRRILQTEAEAVTDLWDEAGRSVPDGGPLKERGRRNIAAMLVLAASSHPRCLLRRGQPPRLRPRRARGGRPPARSVRPHLSRRASRLTPTRGSMSGPRRR